MKKLPLFAVLALAAGATVFAVPAADARDRGGERMTFETLDTNGDGAVTQAELDALRESRFAEFDANGDGSVTLEEFTARAQVRSAERATAMFERLDADGDGVLSRDVLETQGRGRGDRGNIIARLDTDGDGAVSKEEFEAMKARRADMREGRGHRRGGEGGLRNQ